VTALLKVSNCADQENETEEPSDDAPKKQGTVKRRVAHAAGFFRLLLLRPLCSASISAAFGTSIIRPKSALKSAFGSISLSGSGMVASVKWIVTHFSCQPSCGQPVGKDFTAGGAGGMIGAGPRSSSTPLG